MYGKRKSGVFFADSLGFEVSFLEISQRRHVRDVITTSQRTSYNNHACLNFAVTGSRILLHPLRFTRKGKLSRKIALNSNGEVNCRELARRPWPQHTEKCGRDALWEDLDNFSRTAVSSFIGLGCGKCCRRLTSIAPL